VAKLSRCLHIYRAPSSAGWRLGAMASVLGTQPMGVSPGTVRDWREHGLLPLTRTGTAGWEYSRYDLQMLLRHTVFGPRGISYAATRHALHGAQQTHATS
jgi:DNA-binding transcriptional MerR regulator